MALGHDIPRLLTFTSFRVYCVGNFNQQKGNLMQEVKIRSFISGQVVAMGFDNFAFDVSLGLAGGVGSRRGDSTITH